MTTPPIPTPDELRQLLSYDPETGLLTWRLKLPEMCSDGGGGRVANAKTWNANWGGKVAGDIYGHGYRTFYLNGRNIRAHRAIWAMVHGDWPELTIDHINGDRSDNRISNLRSVSYAENSKNLSRACNNTSGVSGVSKIKGYQNKWQAYIGGSSTGNRVALGWFDSFDEAVKARKKAEKAHGYHQNHGR